jgi:hypothetical protein
MLFTTSTLYVSSHFFGFSRQVSALLLTFSVTIISSLFSYFNDNEKIDVICLQELTQHLNIENVVQSDIDTLVSKLGEYLYHPRRKHLE